MLASFTLVMISPFFKPIVAAAPSLATDQYVLHHQHQIYLLLPVRPGKAFLHHHI